MKTKLCHGVEAGTRPRLHSSQYPLIPISSRSNSSCTKSLTLYGMVAIQRGLRGSHFKEPLKKGFF